MVESIKSSVKNVLELTSHLVDRFGPRIFGSPSCARAADAIALELERYCDSVRKERFAAHAGAFWHLAKIGSVSYIAGLILMIVGGDWVYLSILFFLIILLGIINFIFYAHLFDPFFPRGEGSNVIGTVEPAGPATQQVIVGSHLDSTYVYSFLAHLRKLFAVRLIGVYLFFFTGLFASLLFSVYRLIYQTEPAYSGVLVIVLLAGLLFIVPFFFYISREGSPGAGDNLLACAMGIKIAELFGPAQKPRPLQRTRVIILSTDGEEAGLLGAGAFTRVHRKELLEEKTYVLNLDSIYKARDLTLLTKDRNGTIRLSMSMVEDCRRIAAELGYPVKMKPLPLGAGATDAARFAEIGVEAVSIVGMPIPPIRENPGFHTPDDTVERIEAQAVEAALSIACQYILEKDRAGWEDRDGSHPAANEMASA